MTHPCRLATPTLHIMCGIIAVLNAVDPHAVRKRLVNELAPRIRHRGPDWSAAYVLESAVFAHERLAIVDINGGAQPLFNEDQTVMLVVNGEIYNHRELKMQRLNDLHVFATASDCEIIVHLFE